MIEEVALATIGGTPASVSAPKVMNVPPPATALTTPEMKTCQEEQGCVEKGHFGVGGWSGAASGLGSGKPERKRHGAPKPADSEQPAAREKDTPKA